MSDQESPSPVPSESDIDEVLARAEALASELSTELGIVSDDATDDVVDPALDALPDADDTAATAVDEQLARVDELAATAAEQIGAAGDEEDAEGHESDGSTDSEGQPEVAGEDPGDSIPAAVPDFMDDLTQPEESAGADGSVASADEAAVQADLESAQPAAANDATPDFMADLTEPEAAAPPPKPAADSTPNPSPRSAPEGGSPAAKLGVVKSKPPGVVGNIEHPPSEPSEADDADAIAETEEKVEAQSTAVPGRSLKHRVAARLKPMAHAALQGMSPIVLTGGEWVIQALEVMDRPTSNIKMTIKTAVGMFALATTGTSIALLLISLF